MVSTSLEPACNRKDLNSICSFEIACAKVQWYNVRFHIFSTGIGKREDLDEDLSKTARDLSWELMEPWGSFVTAEVQELVPILSIGLNEVVRQAGKTIKDWTCMMKDEEGRGRMEAWVVVLVLSLFCPCTSFYSICWQCSGRSPSTAWSVEWFWRRFGGPTTSWHAIVPWFSMRVELGNQWISRSNSRSREHQALPWVGQLEPQSHSMQEKRDQTDPNRIKDRCPFTSSL